MQSSTSNTQNVTRSPTTESFAPTDVSLASSGSTPASGGAGGTAPNDARRGMQLRGTLSEASIAEEDLNPPAGGRDNADQQSVPDLSISETTTIAVSGAAPAPSQSQPAPSQTQSSQSSLHRIPSAPNDISNQVSSLPRSSSRPSSAAATTGQGTASFLQIPDPRYPRRPSSGHQTRSNTIVDFLQSFDEEMEVIRGCGQLSSVLGLMKSFSTTDICNMMTSSYYHDKEKDDLQERFVLADASSTLRPSVSDLALAGYNQWNPRFDLPSIRRLDCASRSLSLWVTIGDPIPPTLSSQLPSPQAHSIVGSTGLGGPGSFVPETPTLPSAMDFVRSMNKKVRQAYIRRRLLSTYRALERLSKSQMNLSAIHSQIQKQNSNGSGAGIMLLTPMTPQTPFPAANDPLLGPGGTELSAQSGSGDQSSAVNSQSDAAAVAISGVLGSDAGAAATIGKRAPVTIKDIERDKGKPLTKYERNIMIFDWLQNLDMNEFEQVAAN